MNDAARDGDVGGPFFPVGSSGGVVIAVAASVVPDDLVSTAGAGQCRSDPRQTCSRCPEV